ncbi:Tripartite ATP-independent periplasmic transporters, DctQ component [Roseivivax jejudonensis]|uniref:TRAP transporter small permease protein n=1 Tax=Roseivivax jejudonensis TaxID=1529041 RepID=A0A1X6Z2V4_9RHOB|nr:C4-dicarboxylate ABC transporter permease [Roseivivax jejudonensis]SLN39158.1 Tripartite ATP-independent periplasmic transporters, DctQ component [Roseivivax jejudonensis]
MDEQGAAGGFWLFDGILWVLQNFVMAFWNLGYALTHPGLWLDWSSNEAIMRFVYYGGSVEFFFVVFTLFLVIGAVGLWRNGFLWGVVRGLEGFANGLGRIMCWAGLLMVLQQVVIVFMQRIFARPSISLGLGIPVEFDISWWSEELKFYNALIVALCLTYTFVQKGHVRVDLVYSAVSFRTKRVIDMVGSVFFMMPMAVLIWLYSWFFMWRHLIVPNPSASEPLERLLLKARALRWNVETIGFSPNGFSAYFLFKVLLVAMTGLIFLQAWAFLFRSYLEWKEGPESEDKYLDLDVLDAPDTGGHEHAEI